MLNEVRKCLLSVEYSCTSILDFKIFMKNTIVIFQTSVFTPAHGTVTSVRVTSLVPAPEVIKLLLDKFKVHC